MAESLFKFSVCGFDDKKNVVVDLQKVTHVNSTGLSILFRGYRKINDAGGKFILVNINDKLKNLLSITKLDTLFDIEVDRKAAMKSFMK